MEAFVLKTRKVVSSGLVALLAAATLAACGDAPEEDTNTGSGSDSRSGSRCRCRSRRDRSR